MELGERISGTITENTAERWDRSDKRYDIATFIGQLDLFLLNILRTDNFQEFRAVIDDFGNLFKMDEPDLIDWVRAQYDSHIREIQEAPDFNKACQCAFPFTPGPHEDY